MAYQIAAVPDSSDSHLHRGHSPIASPFKYDSFVLLCSSWQDFNWHRVAQSLCDISTFCQRKILVENCQCYTYPILSAPQLGWPL